MRKTVLTAALSISLISLSACQTARIQPARDTDVLPERTIAQAPAGEAIELIFKTLADQTVGADTAAVKAFDDSVIALVNSNKRALGITTEVKTISDISAQVANRPKAFLNKFAKLDLSSLNVKPSELKAAADQQFENAEASSTGVKTLGLADISRPTAGPVTADSFKEAIAAGANPNDVTTIINAEKDLESKGHKLVLGGCDHLRSPASVSTLATVVSETDAEVLASDTEEVVDGKYVENLGKETRDPEGACDRARELADPNRCAVTKVLSPKVCAQ